MKNLEKHNKKVQIMLITASRKDASPLPWYLQWDKDTPPIIFNAKGECVAVLNTGNYGSKEIIANAKRLLNGNSQEDLEIERFVRDAIKKEGLANEE